ncbi:hypothetical protein B296_00017926 [Ensete ventricosum]|uniref:Uncharacterized protein n=1 Tax=Ensete ventricosum TaxID=4639 RepID=A0A426Z8S1_ENSVE|nr:hypothetical protein B296_00017926 [Ensete ventricosum]
MVYPPILGDSAAQFPGYGRFTHRPWAVYPSAAASRCPISKSYGLLPVISRRVPSEFLDPFGESPSELPTRFHRIVRTRPDAQA